MKKTFFLLTILFASHLLSQAATRTASVSGNWNSMATWGGAAIPAAGDNVVINSGIAVTINVNPANIVNVTISGTLRFDATGSGRTWTVTGTFLINAGGSFSCNAPGSATAHTFTYTGTSFTNNGTFNMVNGTNVCNVVFGGSAVQTIGGTGGLTFNKLTENNTGGAFKIDYGGGSFTTSESNQTKIYTNVTTLDTLIIKRGLLIMGSQNNGTLSHSIANLKMGSSTSTYSSSVNVFSGIVTITVNTAMIISDATNVNVNFTVNGSFTSPNMSQSNSGIALALLGPNAIGGASSNTVCTINGVTNLPDLVGIVGNCKLFGGVEPKRPDLIFNGSVTMQYAKQHVIDIPFTGNDIFIKTFFFGLFDSIGTHPRIIFNGGTIGSPNVWTVPWEVFNAPIQVSDPPGDPVIVEISESATDWLVNGSWRIPNASTMAVHSDDTLNIVGTLEVQSGGAITGSETESDATGYIATNGPLLKMGSTSALYVQNPTGLGDGVHADSLANVAIKNRTADIDWNLNIISSSGTVEYSSSSAQSVTDRTYNHLSFSGGFVKTLTGNTTVNGVLSNAASTTVANAGFLLNAKASVTNSGTFSGTGKLVLNGTSQQQLSGGGPDWGNFEINNSSDATALFSNITTSGVMTPTLGILNMQTSTLNMGTAGSFATSGTATSFVDGKISMTTASTALRNLPLGDASTNSHFAFTPAAATSTTWNFQYFHTSYSSIVPVVSPLTSVSNVEYYQIDRTSGSAGAAIVLTWDASSTIGTVADVRAARWDGGQWISEGGTPSGIPASGTVTTLPLSTFNSPFTFGSVTSASQTISTSAVSGSPFCPAASVSVPFISTGTFTGGNIYTAQLSDATGSFASPTSIGTLTSTANSGSVSSVLPLSANGTAYRIRVVSSTPVVTGSDNGSDLTINGCAKPTGLAATNITSSSATLSWGAVTCGVKYKVQYRVNGTSIWTKVKSTPPSKNISGLTASTTYQFRVQTTCNGGSKSSFSSIATFATTARMANELEAMPASISVFPNPNSGTFTVEANGLQENETAIIEIVNVMGQIVFAKNVDVTDSHMIIPVEMKSDAAAGFYLIRLTQGERELQRSMVIDR